MNWRHADDHMSLAAVQDQLLKVLPAMPGDDAVFVVGFLGLVGLLLTSSPSRAIHAYQNADPGDR